MTGAQPEEPIVEPARVWMLSFESSDVAQMGGLGAAVASLSRALALDRDVRFFMPSHGRHQDSRIRERLKLRQVPGFVSQGTRIGADGSAHPYRIGLEEGKSQGIAYYLVKGLDENTSAWLDDEQIYDGELTYQKMSLFARGVRDYLDHLLREDPTKIPNLIHANDWHVVPAAVALKQTGLDTGWAFPLVFTIHLLSGRGLPWHYMSGDWSGIKDEPHLVKVNGGLKLMTYRDVWDRLAGGKFERFAAYESDMVTSVSRSYLRETVLPFLGMQGEKQSSERTGFIYNGCDWEERKIVQDVIAHQGDRIGVTPGGGPIPTRWELRRYLLTKALGDPDIAGTNHTRSAEKTSAFSADGPLVLATGRLDRQKGVDVLLKAIPAVLDDIPDARFLLLLVPAFQEELAMETLDEAERYPENVRVVLGLAKGIFQLAHVAADVYAMPSRWEPFGIAALEAMATGNPVVGARVGGITETVVDLLGNPDEGTGRLVPSEDHIELARGLVCFLATMQADEMARRAEGHGGGRETGRARVPVDAIPYNAVRERVASDPTFGSKLRVNCRRRVETRFRSRNSAQMALQVYRLAIRQLSALRKEGEQSSASSG